MIDLRNTEMKLVTVDINTFDANEFVSHVYEPEVCVAFIKYSYEMLDNVFKNAGFSKIKTAATPHYFQILGSYIFIVYLESSVDNFVMREKYYLYNSSENLKAVESFSNKQAYNGSFKDFHSDNEVFNYKLYPESSDMPFYVNYLVRSAYETPKLLRLDLGFKYGQDKFMFGSIFDRADKRIEIQYDTYTPNCQYMYAEFIQFINDELVDLTIFNPKNQKKMSMMNIRDEFDAHITLDNYHLFWERYTAEQLILIEMLMV